MSTSDNRPTIVITMGDPAGIGPEVILSALAAADWRESCQPIVIGDIRVLERAATALKTRFRLNAIHDVAEAAGTQGIAVLDLANANPAEIPLGEATAAGGRASMEAIEEGTKLVRSGAASAIVTAPINKEATKLAKYKDVGHLEYLARVTGATEYATMLVTKELRVVHLTTHYSLRRACDLVTTDRILGKLRLTHRSFKEWGLGTPKIGVAALNPHGSEGGQFGDEEEREIAPAVAIARNEGIDARGPYPADSIFNRAMSGGLDAVLAMYHDQGHIPIKVHGFEESVSVSLGLPLIRTSVDHGTAYDIAGKGVADATSMAKALDVAIAIVNREWLGASTVAV